MRSSARAVLFVLLSCAAAPVSSLSRGESALSRSRTSESWPWSKKKAIKKATEVKLPETRAAFAKPVALSASGPKVMVKTPVRPGCWMRMPSGCPNDPMNTQKWRHDTWAEAEGLGEAACQQRVEIWNIYCGSQDAMMVFIPGATERATEGRSEPLSALQISATHTWSWRGWGLRGEGDQEGQPSWPWSKHPVEEKATKKVHTSSIMEARDEEAPVVSGDGAATTEVASAERAAFGANKDGNVQIAHPTRPGCWMRMASGCPKKPDMQTELWRHDTWAEKHGLDEAACLYSRGAVWNGYCGSTDATMAFVAKQ